MIRLRYSIRTALLAMVLFSTCLGLFAHYVHASLRQKRIVTQMRSAVGKDCSIDIGYSNFNRWNSELQKHEFRIPKTYHGTRIANGGTAFAPIGIEGWIHTNFGIDFVSRPVVLRYEYPHTQLTPEFHKDMVELVRSLNVREFRVFKNRPSTFSSTALGIQEVKENVVTKNELRSIELLFPNAVVSPGT